MPRAAGVALNGGKAYVGQYDLGRLHEVVVADGAAKGLQRVVADGLGGVCGIGLDRDKGRIYVSNRQGKLLRISGVLPGPSAQS
ncbi:hypothetical protein ABT121_25775 [Streptomyces sp. NPDC001928]|uniref:hypothetical protein n=1 Tax=Streptomyces sp. NPDC001928 TaxID=3154404 RepID=UPI0033180808